LQTAQNKAFMIYILAKRLMLTDFVGLFNVFLNLVKCLITHAKCPWGQSRQIKIV